MNQDEIALIQQLASELGTTTKYIWGVLVRQASVYSYTLILMMSLGVLFFIGSYINFRIQINRFRAKHANSSHSETWDTDGRCSWAATILGLSLIGLLFVVGHIPSLINAIYNPEYWALNEILIKIGK